MSTYINATLGQLSVPAWLERLAGRLSLPAPVLDRAGAAAMLEQLASLPRERGFHATRRRLMLERDGRHCYLCGRLLCIHSATIEHVMPLSRGGRDVPANWRLACLRCNQAKDNLTLAEYLALPIIQEVH